VSAEEAWLIPATYRQHAAEWPESGDWLRDLPMLAERLALRWRVEPDGPPMHGWISMVWPVRDAAGRRYVMKLSPPISWTLAEPMSIVAWAEHAAPATAPQMITPQQVSIDDRAVLLPRLDPDRSLHGHPDIDEANEVIGRLLASIATTPAPDGVPLLADELHMIRTRFERDSPVPATLVDRARSTVDDLLVELASHSGRFALLHRDLHYLNVLHTLPGEPPNWLGIDPLPLAGLREWELTPMLRNRWDDAVATGNADRELRRRVDHVAAIAGLDAELVRRCSQIVAAKALHHLLARSPRPHVCRALPSHGCLVNPPGQRNDETDRCPAHAQPRVARSGNPAARHWHPNSPRCRPVPDRHSGRVSSRITVYQTVGRRPAGAGRASRRPSTRSSLGSNNEHFYSTREKECGPVTATVSISASLTFGMIPTRGRHGTRSG
jgi:streptomycin 6-kinase